MFAVIVRRVFITIKCRVVAGKKLKLVNMVNVNLFIFDLDFVEVNLVEYQVLPFCCICKDVKTAIIA